MQKQKKWKRNDRKVLQKQESDKKTKEQKGGSDNGGGNRVRQQKDEY